MNTFFGCKSIGELMVKLFYGFILFAEEKVFPGLLQIGKVISSKGISLSDTGGCSVVFSKLEMKGGQ